MLPDVISHLYGPKNVKFGQHMVGLLMWHRVYITSKAKLNCKVDCAFPAGMRGDSQRLRLSAFSFHSA